MNTRSRMRLVAGFAATGLAMGALAGCAGGGGDEGGSGDGGDDVTLTWWHNATSGPLPAVWEEVAAEFEAANPGVTVEQTGYQNEELQRTLIPNALAAGDPPDLFQVWPGGELRDQVENGYLMALDDAIPDTISSVGATVNPWQVDGATYGVPFTFGIEGFWYNTEMFEAAGIDETPATLDDLVDAVGALRESGVEPIAVGAGDKWPAAHWWYQFALHSCSPETLQAAETEYDFSDPCFVEAGEQLEEFLGVDPFQEGFLGTPAQTGAGSSAGLVANGQAAMELMGHWNAGTIGGGDGFGCSADAPPECADLLAYIMSDEVQAKFAASGSGIPTVPSAMESLEDPNLAMVAEGLAEASFVQLWLDTAFGTTVGNAMNEGIVNLFGGAGTPQDIVTKMEDAAATL